MKKTKIFYWITTILFALMMLASSVPNILSSPDSVAVFKAMQLPPYLLPFLGVAKVLGVIGILIPGYPRVKEWAYAGLFFDLIGATYCIVATSPLTGASFMLLPFALGILSYVFYGKKWRAEHDSQHLATGSSPAVALH